MLKIMDNFNLGRLHSEAMNRISDRKFLLHSNHNSFNSFLIF